MYLLEREVSKKEEMLYALLSPISEGSIAIKKLQAGKRFFTVKDLLLKAGVDSECIPCEIKRVLGKKSFPNL